MPRASFAPLLLMFLFALTWCLNAAQDLPDSPPSVDCAGDWAPRQHESDVLISPDGRYKVFARVASQIVGQLTTDLPACLATADLLLMWPGDKNYHMVVRDKGEPDHHDFRSILPVDWSPDGRYVLLWVEHATYYSDDIWHIIRLYDVHTGDVLAVDYVEALRRFYDKECYVGPIKVLGFSKKGEVILELEQVDEDLEDCACSDQQYGLWAIEPQTLGARKLPRGFQLRRYGRIEKQMLPKE